MSERLRGRWVRLCCYLCIPLSGMALCCASRDRTVRFHARQGIVLGMLYCGVLMGLSMLDAFGGAMFRWAGAFVAAAAPVVAIAVAVVWLGVVWQVAHGRPGRLPVIGRWVE